MYWFENATIIILIYQFTIICKVAVCGPSCCEKAWKKWINGLLRCFSSEKTMSNYILNAFLASSFKGGFVRWLNKSSTTVAIPFKIFQTLKKTIVKLIWEINKNLQRKMTSQKLQIKTDCFFGIKQNLN